MNSSPTPLARADALLADQHARLPDHEALAAMRPRSPAWDEARAEALPYAKAIVAARELPARFNQADVRHAIGLEVGALASTAIAQQRTVEEVARRSYPELFGDAERAAAALQVAA